jgi:hypothetical protein
MTERRRFIVKAGGVVAGVAAGANVDAPSVIAQRFRTVGRETRR